MSRNFEDILLSVDLNTKQANDATLENKSFVDKLYELLQAKYPSLDLPKTKIEIKSEVVNVNNAPNGIPVNIGGSKINYAIYEIPIKGDFRLVVELIRDFIDRKVVFMQNNALYYREYHMERIEGNDILIDKIRTRFKQFIDNVLKILKDYEDKVRHFNSNELLPKIESSISKEIEKRKTKYDSEDKLNPFK